MGENLPILFASKNVFIGMFFNQFLPSTFGGDFYRIFLTKKYGISLTVASFSIISDRIFGFLGLLILCLIGTPFILYYSNNYSLILSILFILFLFTFGLLIIYLLQFIPYKIKITYYLNELSKKILELLNLKKYKLKILSISFVLHILNILFFYLMTLASSLDIDLFTWFIIIPPVILISSMPISIGGWGVREGAMIIALVELGINEVDAIMLSLSYGFALLIAGLLGGILWIFDYKFSNN
jgi:hypothetical protein